MTPLVLAAAAGAVAGLGLFVLAREARPAPPRLDAALAQLEGTHPPGWVPRGAAAGRREALQRRVGGWLAARLDRGGWAVPRRDLALVGDTVEKFAAQKILMALGGLAAPPLLGVVLALLGLGLPSVLPAAAGLVLAAGGFFAPDAAVRTDARKHRGDFRHAMTSYLDLVSLELAAGAHVDEALERAAHLAEGWVFARLAGALDRARRAQDTPWRALGDLAEEVGVDELADLADIAALAADEGAAVSDTVASKTESLREQALSAARAQANQRTTTMVVPVALLGIGFMVLLAFPVMYRLVAGG